MNITKQVTDNISLINLGYKYNSQKFLGFIATEGDGIIFTGDNYLYSFPDTYSNVYI